MASFIHMHSVKKLLPIKSLGNARAASINTDHLKGSHMHLTYTAFVCTLWKRQPVALISHMTAANKNKTQTFESFNFLQKPNQPEL